MSSNYINTEIRAEICSADTIYPAVAKFTYLVSDPYAVSVTFTIDGNEEQVSWIFGRDIMLSAINQGACGEGDVAWFIQTDMSMLSVMSPEGHAVARFVTDDVLSFVSSTLDLVPVGEESKRVDWDTGLNNLLEQ